jgi:O-antigen/teichoic acid export membrane protein
VISRAREDLDDQRGCACQPGERRIRIMMAALIVPIAAARTYVRVARTDSLVRNSLFMMTSTAATGLLGYVFWIVVARVFSSADVGTASAVISLCSTVALLIYLGPAAMLIERLHAYERSPAWTSFLFWMCVATGAVTALVAAVAIPLIARSGGYGSFFRPADAAVLAVIGAVAWTVVNMYGSAFIAARRADGLLAVQGLVSVVKVLLVLPLFAVGLGAPGIVVAWVVSSLIGVALGAFWLLPRLGLGGQGPADELVHSVGVARGRQEPRSWSLAVRHLIGQHLTSVGGSVTPLLLPVLVAVRLGVVTNAYFYITWMIGSVFFVVSPSISNALFAESVRAGPGLRATVGKALRVTSVLLAPAMVVMVIGGKLILGIFGQAYVSAGYGLLILLAVSALPDSVSNIAVAVCRATNRLGYSVAINIGILATTVTSSWLLMPRLGLLGVGVSWLGAQSLGAIACIPAYLDLDRKVGACKPRHRRSGR